MEVLIETIIAYAFVFLLVAFIMVLYLRKKRNETSQAEEKIEKAKEYGTYEPVSLHPKVDPDICIGSGACIEACPEKDILGMVGGKSKCIHAANCVGHGACFHACPVEAISLVIGTEKRGVDLPHVSPEYETNVGGVYIAGELGGMGLIKNAVEQGVKAVQNLNKRYLAGKHNADNDVFVIGAGPAGIGATLIAKKLNLKYKAVERDTLGGTVYTFPRAKIVMTSPMELPLYGKVKLVETSKSELLTLWENVLNKNQIEINENEKVNSIDKVNGHFEIKTSKGEYTAKTVVLAIGRRGTPRKLGVPGEQKEKVAYRLLEPELIENKKVLVVGGGDSAIEAVLMVAEQSSNEVTITYRKDKFSRLKPKNLENIKKAEEKGRVKILYESNVKEIKDEYVVITQSDKSEIELENDLVYIFAGGELPNKFLEKVGIPITKKFGEEILKHKN